MAVVASLVEEPRGSGPAAIAAAVAAAIEDATSTGDLEATFGSGATPVTVLDAFLEARPAVDKVAVDGLSRAIAPLRGCTEVAMQCGGGEDIDVRFMIAAYGVMLYIALLTI